jgi:hypothetical protein
MLMLSFQVNRLSSLIHARNTKVYKFANFEGLYFPYFTWFRNKLCNITNSKTLFLAVVIDFVVLT